MGQALKLPNPTVSHNGKETYVALTVDIAPDAKDVTYGSLTTDGA